MAIVFDTHAELEAFCEAFELRETRQKLIRKPRQKFRPVAVEYEAIVEPDLTTVEEQPVAEDAPYTLLVDAEAIPDTGFIEDLLMDLAS